MCSRIRRSAAPSPTYALDASCAAFWHVATLVCTLFIRCMRSVGCRPFADSENIVVENIVSHVFDNRHQHQIALMLTWFAMIVGRKNSVSAVVRRFGFGDVK